MCLWGTFTVDGKSNCLHAWNWFGLWVKFDSLRVMFCKNIVKESGMFRKGGFDLDMV